MESLYNSSRKIFYISIILGFIGFCTSFFILYTKSLSAVFNFSPFLLDSSRLSTYIKGYIGLGREDTYLPFSCFFSILLIIGSIVYIKKQDVRLLGFCLSLIFFSAVVGVFRYFFSGISASPIFFSGCILFSIYGILSFQILKRLKQNIELVVESYELMGVNISNYVETSSWQRFIHLVIDILVIILTITPFILFLTSFVEEGNDDDSLYIVIVLFSFIYYITFEGFLGTTPGKLLLGNRVIEKEKDNTELTKGTALLRTFFRLIPFERIAFLLGYRWHDNWSKTDVVKERKSTCKSIYYWIGVVVLLHLLTFWGVKTYKSRQVQSSELQSRIENINQ